MFCHKTKEKNPKKTHSERRRTEDNDVDAGAVLPFLVVQSDAVLAGVALLSTLADQHRLVTQRVHLEAVGWVDRQATLKRRDNEFYPQETQARFQWRENNEDCCGSVSLSPTPHCTCFLFVSCDPN